MEEFVLFVTNDVVYVDDILGMNNYDDALTKSERYNASIFCH